LMKTTLTRSGARNTKAVSTVPVLEASVKRHTVPAAKNNSLGKNLRACYTL